MKYTIHVDDNFHYMDEDERYTLGEFDTAEAAIAAARDIVDQYLQSAYKPGISARELYDSYVTFGEDPWISTDDGDCKFSAWDYAKQRAVQMCGGGLD